MSLPGLIDALHRFGPFAIMIGAAVEGQTAVMAGGALSQQRMIAFTMVVGCACAGSAIADQALFLVGRYARSSRFIARATQKPAFARALRFVERRPVGFTMSFRFIFGLRAAGPVALGVSQLNAGLFGS